MATLFTGEGKVLEVELGGRAPFLPKLDRPLPPNALPDVLGKGLTLGLAGGGGLQSGGGMGVLGETGGLSCDFFPLDVPAGAAGEDEA